jgi:hypothetical protein
MGKITVKHYLNTNLKPYEMDGEKMYKLYFLLRYNNKNTKIKSLVNAEMTEKEYNERIKNDSDTLNIQIKNEIIFIEKVVQITEQTKLAFDMKLFSDIWEIATYPIISNFDSYIQWVAYRLKGLTGSEIDFYNKQNIEAYYNTLNTLKLYIDNSKYNISDEIFLLQFFDNEFITDYKKYIPKKEQKKIIYERKQVNKEDFTDEKDYVSKQYINYEYENKETDTLQIIKDCIFGDNYKYPFFYQCPEIERTGNFEIDKDYFSLLFGLITGK